MAAPMRTKLSILRRSLYSFRADDSTNYVARQIPCADCRRSASNTARPNDYCRDLVRKADYEGYLCTLLYPKDSIISAFALRALYIELAQVQDVTTDGMRAIMRFQFWKDSIDKMFKGTPPKTPVAYAVTRAIERHGLSKMWFTRMLDGRVKQSEKNRYKSLAEVEEIADQTTSSLAYLLLETAGIKDMNADHAASHLGQCQGLVTLLRGTTYHAKRNKIYIPQDLLLQHKVSEEQILRCKNDANVRDVMFDIAKQAVAQLDAARNLKTKVPNGTHPYFIHSYILDKYLQDLQKLDFDVFHPVLQKRTYNLAWYLWRKKTFSRTF